MRYFKLYDFLSPSGENYIVDENLGITWCVNWRWEDPVEAFVESAKQHKTTQFFQLQDYASKWGKLEEVECPVS